MDNVINSATYLVQSIYNVYLSILSNTHVISSFHILSASISHHYIFDICGDEMYYRWLNYLLQ